MKTINVMKPEPRKHAKASNTRREETLTTALYTKKGN